MRHHRGHELAALVSLLALAAAPALAGCGDDETSASRPALLSAREQSQVRQAQIEIRSYCRELVLYLARRRGPPTQTENGRAYGAVDRLLEIARAKPDASHPQSGRTVREMLGDIAEDLEGSNCAPNVAQRIDQGLASIPAQ